MLAGCKQKIRAIYPLDGAAALEAAQPDQRHTVRGGESGPVEDVAEVRIPLGLNHRVDVCDAHVAPQAGLYPLVEGGEGGGDVGGIDPDAENVDPV
jgi:hypothetical protein